MSKNFHQFKELNSPYKFEELFNFIETNEELHNTYRCGAANTKRDNINIDVINFFCRQFKILHNQTLNDEDIMIVYNDKPSSEERDLGLTKLIAINLTKSSFSELEKYYKNKSFI